MSYYSARGQSSALWSTGAGPADSESLIFQHDFVRALEPF